MHLLSIEPADWPKLHDIFKACDANVWQREFPAGFSVAVSALNSLLINIFHDVVACIESRCVTKGKHVLLVCWIIWFCAGKTALALKHSCIFSCTRSKELTDQQDLFFYTPWWCRWCFSLFSYLAADSPSGYPALGQPDWPRWDGAPYLWREPCISACLLSGIVAVKKNHSLSIMYTLFCGLSPQTSVAYDLGR